MSEIQLSSIRVEERLREDLGELGELMASIQQYGLLHPIVIDDKRRLIAGHRRLEACKRLGKKRVEVKSLGELSADERREIELEENIRRKDLTEYERSRKTRELVEVAQEIAAKEISPTVGEKSKPRRGRPKKPGSQAAAAERTGIPQQTISRANEHVSAGEKYHFLQDRRWSQTAAIKMAKVLDDIGRDDVEYLFRFCSDGRGGAPKQIAAFFETWRAADAKTRKKLRKSLEADRHRSSRTVSLMAKTSPRADPALHWVDDAIPRLRSLIQKRPKGDGLLPEMRGLMVRLQAFESVAEEYNRTSIEKLRKELMS